MGNDVGNNGPGVRNWGWRFTERQSGSFPRINASIQQTDWTLMPQPGKKPGSPAFSSPACFGIAVYNHRAVGSKSEAPQRISQIVVRQRAILYAVLVGYRIIL